MKTLYTTIFLLVAGISLAQAQQAATTEPVYSMAASPIKPSDASAEDIKKEHARIAIISLIKGIFNGQMNEQAVTLTVDAGWRDDSLSIEYKYFRGQLIEKIYFTFLPQEISLMVTEQEEFLFLSLSSKKGTGAIRKLVSRSAGNPGEISNVGSFSIPVVPGNLELIKKSITELR